MITDIKYSVAFKTKEGDHISRQTMSVKEYIDFLQFVLKFEQGFMSFDMYKEEYPSAYFTTEKRVVVFSND